MYDKIRKMINEQDQKTEHFKKQFDEAIESGNKLKARDILRLWLTESDRLDIMHEIYTKLKEEI